jgi:hypothetical protein
MPSYAAVTGATHAAGSADPTVMMSMRLGFLSPEDPVFWCEPEDLIKRFARGLTEGPDLAAYAAANRLALEAFRSGERELAADVCHLEIDYAAARLRASADEQIAMLGLQPVINLIRLHGYVGDLEFSRQGLADLERVAHGHAISIGGLPLADPPPARMQALARNNCLIETAKIFWRRGLTAELIVGTARLERTWPRSMIVGPFHATEAAWLAGPTAELAARSLPPAPVLRRICALHLLARSASSPAEPTVQLADELFASRADALAKPPPAAAHDLACLGGSLAAIGRAADAAACLAQAHEVASPVDPALANLIRASWLALGSDPATLPGELNTARLSGQQLRACFDLAIARFVPAWSRS